MTKHHHAGNTRRSVRGIDGKGHSMTGTRLVALGAAALVLGGCSGAEDYLTEPGDERSLSETETGSPEYGSGSSNHGAYPGATEDGVPLPPSEPYVLDVGSYMTMSATNWDGELGTVRYTLLDIEYDEAADVGDPTRGLVAVNLKLQAQNFGQTKVDLNFGHYWRSPDNERRDARGSDPGAPDTQT